MDHHATLIAILAADPLRIAALEAVRALAPSDAWIGGGFVRDAVWDYLHGYPPTPPRGDVDMIWFDPAAIGKDVERALERRLTQAMPSLDWSAKNQARMHLHNGDAPYADIADAMRHWPETATAVAVRLSPDDRMEINATFGLDDLFDGTMRPTPSFADAKYPMFRARIADKQWLRRYPYLNVIAGNEE